MRIPCFAAGFLLPDGNGVHSEDQTLLMSKEIPFLTLSIFLYSFLKSQTTIIIRKTDSSIYVGADSRLVSTTRNKETPTIDTTYRSVCKIYNINNHCFAVAGRFFSVSVKTAKKYCLREQSIESAAEMYALEFSQILADSMIAFRHFMNSEVDSIYKNGTINKIVFFGYTKGLPFLRIYNFYIKNITEDNIEVSFGYYSAKNSTLSTAIGHYQHIKSMISDETVWKDDPVSVINRLISIEAKADSIYVGGSIDIIKVTAEKTDWLQVKNECQD